LLYYNFLKLNTSDFLAKKKKIKMSEQT